jgi:hypothetical protein
MPGYEDADLPCPRLGGGAEGGRRGVFEVRDLAAFIYTRFEGGEREWDECCCGVGEGSGEQAFYVRTTVEQKEILGCERYMLPGNHTGYRYELEAFAMGVLKIFGELEERERMRR